MRISDILNNEGDLYDAFQKAVDNINKKSGQPPIVIDDLDLDDAESGHITISGGGLKSPMTLDFDADDTVEECLFVGLEPKSP